MQILIKIKNILIGPVYNSQSGESLLSLLVSLALASILVLQINNVAKSTISSRQHNELRKNKNDIKRMFLNTLDCKSFDYSCDDGDPVTLKNFEGEILVATPYSSYGRWSVRAVCQDNTPELLFALLDPADDTKFLKDPKTRKEMNWSEPAVVAQGELCRTAPNPLQIIVGTRCDRETRLISGSPLSGATPSPMWLPGLVCNPDGSDEPKPNCPTGTYEVYSYWDRDDDWGKSGSWVVACR
ncbi:MAG: hypothetical protein AB8G05_08510 [Oligoflexales bacterium]